MKLNIKKKPGIALKGKKPSPLYGGAPAPKSPTGSQPDWLILDKEKQVKALNQQRRSGTRVPEIWLREDESKLLRFRYPDCSAVIWAYSAKLRNGKFDKFTCPPDGAPDLFRDELGMKPSFKAIYEVVDIKGYVDKNGKKVRNTPRFFVVSHKVHEQLQKLREKKGGLDRMNIEVSRTGTGNQTTYMFLPEPPSPMTPEMKAAEKLTPKIRQYFRPLTEAEQRSVVPQIIPPSERTD